MIEALDRYVVELAKTSPGFSVTRNDAMRRLLVLGLEREGIDIGERTSTAMQHKAVKGTSRTSVGARIDEEYFDLDLDVQDENDNAAVVAAIGRTTR